ncbi:aminotransferase class IV [Hwanghaeella sp.]|uniref:aminotransferase class IV n=1 Tax=Hwanghaeella sp. TaxID=2605943 RepID=UPI003CCC13C7
MTHNPDFKDGAAYIGGEFVPIGEAKISVLDWGFTRSDAVYDVVHVKDGRFFRLDDHLARFERSMARRRIELAEDRQALKDILVRCVQLAGLTDSYVAMVASRGRPRVKGSRKPSDCANHLVAYAIPWIDVIPLEVQERGAKLLISDHPRVADEAVDPTVKNYQWSDLTSGLFDANDEGFDTAVLCDGRGMVTEGPGFNVFAVIGGGLVTPERGCLHGITRQSVIDICGKEGIVCRAGDLPRADLETAEEVFLCTTAGGIMPIAQVGERVIEAGAPGPVTRRVMASYTAMHEDAAYVTFVDTPTRFAAAE